MDDFQTYYQILELAESATHDEIKTSWRRLAKEYHTDGIPTERTKLREEITEKLQQVNEAYGILSKPDTRQKYDEQLKELREQKREASNPSRSYPPPPSPKPPGSTSKNRAKSRRAKPSQPSPKPPSPSSPSQKSAGQIFWENFARPALTVIVPALWKGRRQIGIACVLALAVYGSIALHKSLLAKTTLAFEASLDGRTFPSNRGLNIKIDGKPFISGDKIGLGHHLVEASFAGGEPFSKEIWTFYGKNNLGLLPLETSKGSLSVTVNPMPAKVVVQKDGKIIQQGDAPIKLNKLPVGDYTLLIQRGEYEESSSVKIEREQQTKADIELNIGTVDLASVPSDADFELSGNEKDWHGKLPIHIDNVPSGLYQFVVSRKNWETNREITVIRGNNSVEQIEFPYGSIAVASEPAGMDVSANGVEIGKTPTILHELQPGKYKLIVTDGQNDLTEDVDVAPKEAAKRNFIFRYGTVQLSSAPSGATVIRNGKIIGKTPLMIDHVTTEKTMVELQFQDYLSTNFLIHAREGVTNEFSTKLVSERYVKAMNEARDALDANEFEKANNSVAIAIEADPTDQSAATLLAEITQKTETWKQQQIEAARLAAEERARELAAIPMLVPETVIKKCWYVPPKEHSAIYDAAHSNPQAIPAAAIADIVVTGIKIIAWPFHKSPKEPRFDQGIFYSNYENNVYRYHSNIASVDINNRTITFAVGGKSKQSYMISAHLSDEVSLANFDLRPGSSIWVSGQLVRLQEGNPVNILALDNCKIYASNVLTANK